MAFLLLPRTTQVRRAKTDPDLSQKLSQGLSYLNADEMEEIQQALAMAIYAHSLTSSHGGGYKAVKVRSESGMPFRRFWDW